MFRKDNFYSASYRLYVDFVFVFPRHHQAGLHMPLELKRQLAVEQLSYRFVGNSVYLNITTEVGQPSRKHAVRSQA